MKLVVGLGNPQKEYEFTRHNIGFMVLDSFVSGFAEEKKFSALIKKEKISGVDVLFVKPLTFMNLSGNAVSKIARYYQIDVEDILVIQDDLDMKVGTYKLKKNSSSGGHNGIKSIIENLKTQQFTQLKIGISNNKNYDTKDYVLGKFSKQENEKLNSVIVISQKIIDDFIKNDKEYIMNTYNGLLK